MAYLGTKPANQVIDSTLIADGTITPADLSAGKPVWNTSGDVGIGTNNPTFDASRNGLVVKGATTNGAEVIVQSGADTGSTGLALAKFGVDTGIFNRSNGFLNFGTNNTERIRITAAGNVGIGVTNPSSALHVNGTAIVSGAGSFGNQLSVVNSGSNFNGGINLNAAGNGFIVGTNQDNANSTSSNIKIASWFGIGFASSISGQPVPNGENAAWINCRDGGMGIRGTLTQNASDRRLKENFKVIPNALDKIALISGYTFDWKMDKCFDLGFKPAQEHEHGVIAQEIKEVIPDAVTLAPFDTGGQNEGTNFSKSGEEYLTVKIEKLIPLLLQGIKEQQAIITAQADTISAMEVRLTALEAK